MQLAPLHHVVGVHDEFDAVSRAELLPVFLRGAGLAAGVLHGDARGGGRGGAVYTLNAVHS